MAAMGKTSNVLKTPILERHIKKNAIPLKIKIDIIKAVDAGGSSKTEICKRFGVANSTLSTILKNREKLTEMFEYCIFEPDRKRMRTAKYEDLEAALLMWFEQTISQDVPMSGPLIMQTADSLAMEMGIEFSSNPGWLGRFKKRNGIVLKSLNREPNKLARKMTSDRLETILSSTLLEYDCRDIFNADETVIYYRFLPDKNLHGEKNFDGKTKERMTVMVACNADGSEKLPLLVIGENKYTHSFKNIKKMPVEFMINKNSCMTRTIFTYWLKALDKKFSEEKRKVVLVVDNCPAHVNMPLEAIKLVFLPSNANIHQPCNQGIIQNFKFLYRKQLLRKYLTAVEAKEEFDINIMETLHMMRIAWNSVAPLTIENCFRRAGFIKSISQSEYHFHNTQEVDPTTDEMFERATSILKSSVSLQEFIGVDNDVCSVSILTDDDIVNVPSETASILESENTEGDQMENVPIPSNSEMRRMFRSIRRYLDVYSNGEVTESLDNLEQFVENKIINDCMQSKEI